MKTAIFLFGKDIITKIISFFTSKTGKTVLAISLFLILLEFIPFEIKIPNEIMDVLTSYLLINIFLSMTFFFPIGFALKCLLVVLMTTHSRIFLGIITRIYRIITGGFNGD